jgi:flagellar hook-length control protein FliK
VTFQVVPASDRLAARAAAPALGGVDPAARNTNPEAAAGAVPAGTMPVAAAPQPLAVPVPAPAQVPAHPVSAPPGFAAQLVRPVFTLASAGPGEHTITVAVNPENLGPVTVQAHINASGVRVELFAASSDGRDVLRQILPDLKRDLAGSGLNATLDLSSGGQPGSGQGSRDEFLNRRAPVAYPGAIDSRQSPMNSQASRVTPGLRGTDGTLDVMA